MLEVRTLIVPRSDAPHLYVRELRVRGGEVVAIIGENGSGKTRLANALAGVGPIAGGSIAIGEVAERIEVQGLPAWERARRGFVYVPADGHVFGRLSVRDNLTAVAAGRGVRRAARQSATDAALYFAPMLRDRLSQAAVSLSGGERRILALAMAATALHCTTGTRAVLLVDEPTRGLHRATVEQVDQFVRSVAESGTSVLILDEADAFVRAVTKCVLRMGADIGTKQQVTERPNRSWMHLAGRLVDA